MSKSARKAERMELRRTIGQRKPLRLSESSRPRTPYHLAHVCFVCRRSNKLSPATTGARKCSRCAGPLYEMGRSFRAPAPDDVEQWTKVQTLYALGFRFVGSGRHQGAPFPERLRDVAAFARDNPEHPLRRADVLRELLPAAPRKRKRAGQRDARPGSDVPVDDGENIMNRTCQYVGPAEIAAQADAPIERLVPRSPDDVRRGSGSSVGSTLALTYIIDLSGNLVLSDRRSEHVACARGMPVLGAGEIVFTISPTDVRLVEVTNQSTGYCPEPECWDAVRDALTRAGFRAPPGFTHAFEFRKCVACGAINILKRQMPECPQRGTDLPEAWNFAGQMISESDFHRVCRERNVKPMPPAPGSKVGIAINTLHLDPVNGLRHPPTGDTSGWYIWAGELSDDPDFFQPVHVEHLSTICPSVLPYLALPAGWRFLLGHTGCVDVWYDVSLLVTQRPVGAWYHRGELDVTLRRKDTRKIVVDDVSYRWTVSPDDEPGVAIIVENWVRPARRLVTWVPHGRSITPKLVRSAISDGLAEGWVPMGRGSDSSEGSDRRGVRDFVLPAR